MSAPEPNLLNQVVVFTLDEPRYALPLSAVERVVRAVEIVPLPGAPEIVLGVIEAQGRAIPVVDVRKRFNLEGREMALEDRLIIARTPRRHVALVVESVSGVRYLADGDVLDGEEGLPAADLIQGIVKTPAGLILIQDLERFLSLDEERALDEALAGDSE